MKGFNYKPAGSKGPSEGGVVRRIPLQGRSKAFEDPLTLSLVACTLTLVPCPLSCPLLNETFPEK
jgi:hypothetical protein